MKSGGRMYRIPKAGPFEPIAQSCERGSTLLTMTRNELTDEKKNEWLEASFLKLYERQGMRFA